MIFPFRVFVGTERYATPPFEVAAELSTAVPVLVVVTAVPAERITPWSTPESAWNSALAPTTSPIEPETS